MEEFQNLDTRHKKKIQLTIEQKEDWQTLLLSSQFRVYFVTNQYDTLLQIEQTVLDFFKISNPKLWNANSGMFIYYFAHVHFLKKNYQHCIDLLVDLLKTELTKEVATFIDKGSILYLICHYELGNFKFLEYEINKVLRRAGGNKTLDSKPALLAKTLKKVLLPNFDFSSLAKDKNVQKLKKIETETFDANRDISIIEWLNKLY